MKRFGYKDPQLAWSNVLFVLRKQMLNTIYVNKLFMDKLYLYVDRTLTIISIVKDARINS